MVVAHRGTGVPRGRSPTASARHQPGLACALDPPHVLSGFASQGSRSIIQGPPAKCSPTTPASRHERMAAVAHGYEQAADLTGGPVCGGGWVPSLRSRALRWWCRCCSPSAGTRPGSGSPDTSCSLWTSLEWPCGLHGWGPALQGTPHAAHQAPEDARIAGLDGPDDPGGTGRAAVKAR